MAKKDTIKQLLQKAENCLVRGENKDAEMIARHIIAMDGRYL